jgi:PAS domain S-box-containing protein
MDQHSVLILLYLTPILLSLGVSSSIGFYLFSKRHVLGARSFGVVIIFEAAWTIGLLFELLSPMLNTKIFWDNLQWIPALLLPLACLSFAIRYSGWPTYQPWKWAGLSLVPLAIMVLIFTNPFPGLVNNSVQLIRGMLFSEYSYQFGPLLWVGVAYSYVIFFIAITILVNLAMRQRGIYRIQTWISILGLLIPFLGPTLILFGIKIGPQRDFSPYLFILANILVALGFSRYHVFDLVPLARELVIDSMEDGEIVLDPIGHLVDINPAARILIGRPDSIEIGQSFHAIAGDWLDQVALHPEQNTSHRELTIAGSSAAKTIDLRITRLTNPQGDFSGYLIILRDISDQKMARAVVEENLRESREKYRALFSNSGDAIFVLENATIVDCNTSALRLFGARREELLGRRPEELSPEMQANGETSAQLAARLIAEALHEGHCRFEWTHRRMDGQLFETEIILDAAATQGAPILQATIRDMTIHKKAEEEVKQAYEATLEGWAQALELRELETAHHSDRVVHLTLAVARKMGIKEADCIPIRQGARLHDIGKMGIPDSILLKNGPLDDNERVIMSQHPVYAYNLLSKIPYLREALEIPYAHHERWDGSGYPRGLKGNEIPLSARIFMVVDVWDALTSDRPYRQAWMVEAACNYLRENAGKLFDEQVVGEFLQIVREQLSSDW